VQKPFYATYIVANNKQWRVIFPSILVFL
jgi:hypothetical protein